MTSDFEQNLKKYAEVIVKVGLNIQPGQRLLIGPPLYGHLGTEHETAPLVRFIAAEAYQAGARLVDVMWRDDQLQLIRLQHAPRDSFEEFPTWRASGAIEAAREGDALLFIGSLNIGLFTDQDPDLIKTAFSTNMKHMKPFLDLRGKGAMNFALVAAPIRMWADKVFPEIPTENRIQKFWDAVFEVCRVNQPDPVSAWGDHVSELKARCDSLNIRQYSGIHFKASGTNLRLGLPNGHIWRGGALSTQSGIDHVPNIPTEEVFTIPHKDKTEGIVTSTIPLYTRTGLIEDLTFTFSKGKIIKATAKKGEDALHRLLGIDEGVKRLGEVALVPHSTPISQTGRYFYMPLYDENASCHLALGSAYRFCLGGGENMSDEEFIQAGGNNSINHADFMIGSENMEVDGIKEDGSTEPIMRGGEWAFDL